MGKNRWENRTCFQKWMIKKSRIDLLLDGAANILSILKIHLFEIFVVYIRDR